MRGAAAILAVGYGLADATAALTSLVAHVGEALLATAGGWHVRRLSPMTGERDGADRATLKRIIGEACDADVHTIMLVLAGAVVMHRDEPCLVTGNDAARYADETTLPLAWIRDQLRNCRAERVIVVASLEGPIDDSDWLDALATGRARHVIAVERSGGRVLALTALLDGLRGGAIDAKTGTVTLRSLGEHLGRVATHARLQLSEESETLASSPPLAGPWDARLTSRPEPRCVSHEEIVGTVLPGRFEILREIARGSFGNVYAARQLSVGRDVAIKVLSGSIAPGSETGRLFVQEIQSVGKLDHPNIVRIYQADITAGGSLFYAMELLAGRDLQQIIEQDGPMERTRATAIVRQLASALGAAHERDLVHADVKPANAVVVPGPEERLVLLDFGLARLRGAAGGTDSAGGTPAYMAPEQLRDGRVDARSDVFSAGLVLVTLLTGWRRRSADQLVPPLEGIHDPGLHKVLTKALALEPRERYANGGELATALGERASQVAVPSSPPFRHLASFTEDDHLYGREREIATLVEHVLFRRAVVYTAPSGTGKTSLLRAGLVPRLASLGVDCVYVACHGREPPDLVRELGHQGSSLAAAAAHRISSTRKRMVVVIDQVEAALGSEEFVASLRELDRATTNHDLGVVLSVREDVLARLLAALDTQTNVLRLGPLTLQAAREAIVGPLIERRVTIEETLLVTLLADLERAASVIAAEMRWSAAGTVYPPHLQLACSALYDRLGQGEHALASHHYKQLGGLDEIVRDYLDRVLETELPAALVAPARRVLLALVESDRTRAVRTDRELAERLPQENQLAPVLEALRQRGIIVPLRSAGGQPAWELVHDSLVPRVLAWSDRADLARQRALEIVRHHLRGSRGERPSLLTPSELREVKDHTAAIEEIDREWAKRGAVAWTPVKLVERSRRARRERWLAIAAMSVATVVITAVLGIQWFAEREQRRHEQLLSKGDIGIFVLELTAFDWGPDGVAAVVPITRVAGLEWTLLHTATDDELAPSDIPLTFTRDSVAAVDPRGQAWRVEARAGKVILSVSRRGCATSFVPLARLPGYAQRDQLSRFAVVIPTCEATRYDMIDVESGPYISGGSPAVAGVSPEDVPPEVTVDLPRFAIDRTEVPNRAYQLLATPAAAIQMPTYPMSRSLEHASEPAFPVAGVTWAEAYAFCRFIGKHLPSGEQWEKAMRGGLHVHGELNAMPRRTVPWGVSSTVPANLRDTGGEQPAPIGSNPGDVSPYGVLDLAGNTQEWTRTTHGTGFHGVRGCAWSICSTAELGLVGLPNTRPTGFKSFELGFRCVVD